MYATGDLLELVRAPVSTEKASGRGPRQQYAFRVAPAATKPLIKRAIEMAFDVKVASVRVLTVPGKERRFKGQRGRRSGWKKAYVQLADGFSIADLASG